MTDIGWGKLESDEKYGRPGDKRGDYVVLDYEKAKSDFQTCKHAAHAMLFARENRLLWDLYHTRAALLMQFRDDGLFGFPGGLVEAGETPVIAVNREMEEEMRLDLTKHHIEDKDHVVSYYNEKKNLVLHFYGLELTMEDYLEMEKTNIFAEDYGIETFGILRAPLFTMGDGYRGFPAFLSNGFSGNAREQLLSGLIKFKLLSPEEVQSAREAVREFQQNGCVNISKKMVSRPTSI